MDYLESPASGSVSASSMSQGASADRATWQLPAQLSFSVSQDEEHVFLCIECVEGIFELGERIHHYPLLVLSRLRLEDARRGLEPASQGWVDLVKLANMLGIDSAYLNIQIFRARRQIAKAFGDDTPMIEIVQRRRGQIRIGAFAIWIVRG